MNHFFDFTKRQLQFVVILSISALVLGVISYARHVSTPSPQLPAFQISVGDNETVFTGVFTLDPNTAPVDSLELLPGIGPVLAERIVEYRLHHRFEQVIDLTDVPGIGPRTFERLRPYLRINPW
jgi:competence protein ComEA